MILPALALMAVAAQAAPPAGGLAGVWRGTSLCQVPLPCRDETVVYRIAEAAGPVWRIVANKIVAGREEEMGVIDGSWDAAAGRFVGITRDRQGRAATWTLTVSGNHIAGRAVGEDGRTFRLIEGNRVAQPAS